MTSTDIAKSDLVYNGEIIHWKPERVSLTDMHKAAGSPANRDPAQWLRSADAKRFIAVLGEILTMGNSHSGLVKTVNGGKTPGTWAHWQIAMNYARYLDPAFAVWCNSEVRSVMEGRAVATARSLTDYDMRMIGTAINNCAGKVVREQLEVLIPAIVEPMVAARMAEQSFLIRRGKTSGQIWVEHGFPRIRVTSWFSSRLVKMGCQINDGGRGELGNSTAKMFDPDKAALWLQNGGKALVNEYVAGRMGQGKLRLVTGAAA